MHRPDKEFPVYEVGEWLHADWDPRSYGRDYDFARPFFEQMRDLRNAVPHFSLYTDPDTNVNSEFNNCLSDSKNCYLTRYSAYDENCYYSRGLFNCKDCCDCLTINDCELCYECLDSHHCYRCMYVQDCDNCSECFFSTGLRSCRNCIGCHGLVQKQFCAFNEQLSEEEWKRLYGSPGFTRPVIEEMKQRSDALRLRTPQHFVNLVMCEDVTGDRCIESRNSRMVFDSQKLEDCAYCTELMGGMKDSRDCSIWGERSELFYECQGAGTDSMHCMFCDQVWTQNVNLLYCMQCFPKTKDCFGCFSMQEHRYCILNKQYTKEEYDALVPKIIEHMRGTGEWGEYFPVTLSDYAYNESVASEFYPLSEEEVTARGWHWYPDPEITSETPRSLPDAIQEVNDTICNEVLICAQSGKKYKLIKQELAFYRMMNIPVPALSPDQRHKNRMGLRRPWKLFDRECMNCQKAIQTTYSYERPEIVYCEECYLATVY